MIIFWIFFILGIVVLLYTLSFLSRKSIESDEKELLKQAEKDTQELLSIPKDVRREQMQFITTGMDTEL